MEKDEELKPPSFKNKADADEALLVALSEAHREIYISFSERIKEDIFKGDLGEEAKELKAWLDPACLVRYLKAREWDEAASYKMLLKSIEWRTEYKPHLIPKTEIQPILDLGSLYRNGTDRLGRPILYIKPAVYNPHPWELRIRGLVYTLEHTIKSMAHGVEQMVWILDFTGYAQRTQRSEGGAKVAQNSMAILQNQYPERLGNAFIVNSPWWLGFFWTILSPFMASSTKAKIKWLSGDATKLYEQLSPYVADEELETAYGGKRAIGAAAADATPSQKRKEKKETKMDKDKEDKEDKETKTGKDKEEGEMKVGKSRSKKAKKAKTEEGQSEKDSEK